MLRAPAASAETSDVGFFAEEGLLEVSVSRVTPTQIKRMFEHSRRPGWPGTSTEKRRVPVRGPVY